ncbi:MAG: type II restriction endonuclease, partial [Calditrichota bacterium]
MTNNDMKQEFKTKLHDLMDSLNTAISMPDGQWSIKGFIDAYKNIYTISSDTKIISKILEIHLFPLILDFAEKNGYYVVPAQEQNWYPDLSFVHKENKEWKFAVDIKTTYRLDEYPGFCS